VPRGRWRHVSAEVRKGMGTRSGFRGTWPKLVSATADCGKSPHNPLYYAVLYNTRKRIAREIFFCSKMSPTEIERSDVMEDILEQHSGLVPRFENRGKQNEHGLDEGRRN
jgi:hypothetical protein